MSPSVRCYECGHNIDLPSGLGLSGRRGNPDWRGVSCPFCTEYGDDTTISADRVKSAFTQPSGQESMVHISPGVGASVTWDVDVDEDELVITNDTTNEVLRLGPDLDVGPGWRLERFYELLKWLEDENAAVLDGTSDRRDTESLSDAQLRHIQTYKDCVGELRRELVECMNREGYYEQR